MHSRGPSESAVTAGPAIVQPVSHGCILRPEQQPKEALVAPGELVHVDRSSGLATRALSVGFLPKQPYDHGRDRSYVAKGVVGSYSALVVKGIAGGVGVRCELHARELSDRPNLSLAKSSPRLSRIGDTRVGDPRFRLHQVVRGRLAPALTEGCS